MSSMSEATAVILTTYNPDILLLKENLESYVCQVGGVVVCDNTDNKDFSFQIKELCLTYGNTVYISMEGNKGIAFAQNKGVEMAISLGYDYFIEVDQDSKLCEDFVSKIIKTYLLLTSNNLSVAGVGPVAVSKEQGFVYHGYKCDSGIQMVDKTLSSGFFFSKQAYQLVGTKDESLFIDLVDWDWCWRARGKSLNVVVDTSIKIEHMLGSGHNSIFGCRVGMPAPIRLYYQYRNSIYMLSKAHVPLKWKLSRIGVLVLKVPYYLFFANKRLERMRFIFNGVLSAFKKNMGAFKY
nr:glycosyltransferase [Pseudomonas sp.]